MLKDKLAEVQKYDFIEQTARDKLNLSQAGETVMVIPPEEVDKIIQEDQPTVVVKKSNWQGWIDLFLHNSLVRLSKNTGNNTRF